MILKLPPTTAGVMSCCDCPTHEDREKASEWVENAQEDRFSAEATAFAGFASVLASPRLVAGSLVVVVAVLAVFGSTRNVIASAGNGGNPGAAAPVDTPANCSSLVPGVVAVAGVKIL